jgi:hypothetical protein
LITLGISREFCVFFKVITLSMLSALRVLTALRNAAFFDVFEACHARLEMITLQNCD